METEEQLFKFYTNNILSVDWSWFGAQTT